MATRFQLRRDTSTNWMSVDPILEQGEIGFDLTNNNFKIGDGSTAWSSLGWSGNGEVNTASNTGSSGIGVFARKSGTDIELKNIDAGSNKISVSDDALTDCVDIDINESNITHQNLGGAGVYSHSQIDSHISNSNNPHIVTSVHVGKDTAQWNADRILGVAVDDTDKADGKSLVYNSTTGKLEYSESAGQASATAWGDITGTLSNQTDLQGELDGKSDTSHSHSGVYEPVFTKNTGFNKDLGTIAGTVSEGNHTHTDLHTHANKAQLDLITDGDHDVRTDNPHGVDASDVGNTTAQWNANEIQGVAIDATVGTPSDGDILVYRTAGSDFVLEAKPVGGSSPSWGDITGTLSNQTDLQTELDGKSSTTHTHTESDITDLGNYETAFSKNTAFNKNFGTLVDTVCQGNDPRLSDSRTPTAHTHTESDITDLGNYEISFSKNTAFNKNFGSIVDTVCEGNDSRLSDARTPIAHTHTESDITDLGNYETAFSKGNLTELTSNVLTITGGTGILVGSSASIEVSQASTSTSGYLSSTDWNTFNGKGDGTVTSVGAGDGLDFTSITSTGSVTLGTPSTLTTSTTNGVTATSHTHAITLPKETKSITVEEPSSSENICMCYIPQAMTISHVYAVVKGTSPSVTINPVQTTDRSAAGTNILSTATAITNTTTGQTLTSFNDATVPSGSWIVFKTTATSGTVDEICITIAYDID